MELGLDHVSLLVRSMKASAQFYSDVLGLKALPGNPAYPNIRWFEIGGLDALHLTEGDFGDTKLSKTTHFALRVDDLNALVDHLRQRRVAFFDWPGSADIVSSRPDGFRQIYLQDPDGYWVEVNDHIRAVA